MATPWVIELHTPAMKEWLKVSFEDELTIGCSVAGDSVQPDIDLSPYGANQFGVAPRHLRLNVTDNQLFVTDLSTEQGSWLDGKRMEAQKAYPFRDKLRIDLGQMPLEIRLAIAVTEAESPDSFARPGNGELVLVVEDDPEVAKVLSIIMARAGYKPQITHEVVAAIRAFNKQRPSAILLDLMLPDMNGLEFCRYVRRDIIKNTIPVIVVSADTSSRQEALRAGADVFFDKPFDTMELIKSVASLIQQSQVGTVRNQTKQLVGTAPLESFAPELRRYGVVLYVSGYSDAPVALDVREAISFGRSRGPESLESHIDLERFEATTMGVSRLHMILHHRDGRFFVEDRGSTNGTFRNGTPLSPNEQVEVRNGDEVRLGALRMYIYFIEEPGD